MPSGRGWSNMDSLTHIALGATIGEAFYGKKLGRKAMFLGAVAQSTPDIDFVASFWLDTPYSLMAHRGFTHSIMFVILATWGIGHLAERWQRHQGIAMWRWLLFLGTEMLIHIFIDAFNNYGVGWFEPFSHLRVSFQSIFVADPFFSIWPAISFAALLTLKARNRMRKAWWMMGLLMSGLYLSYCVFNKAVISSRVKHLLAKQEIPYTRYFTTPSPLNNWLWFVAAGNDSGYYVGYHSVLGRKPELDLTFFPRNDSLASHLENTEAFQVLKRFSQGYYTIEKWGDTLVFNDLRFGQVIGWHDPKERFAFHYFLNYRENELVVQRGRFAKWDRESLRSLVRRIGGH